MAKNITHGERYRTNKEYKRQVDDLVQEWMLRAVGLTPEMLMEAWDGKRLNVATILHKGRPKIASATQEKSRAEKELDRIAKFLRENFGDQLVGGTIFENITRLLAPGVVSAAPEEGDGDEDGEIVGGADEVPAEE